MADTLDDMIAAVRKHASEHYNEQGWDIIVECYSPAELREALTDGDIETGTVPTTIAQAIEAIRQIATLQDERRREIRATAF